MGFRVKIAYYVVVGLVVGDTLGELVHLVTIFPLKSPSTGKIDGAKEEMGLADANPHQRPVMAESVYGGDLGFVLGISQRVDREVGPPRDEGPSLAAFADSFVGGGDLYGISPSPPPSFCPAGRLSLQPRFHQHYEIGLAGEDISIKVLLDLRTKGTGVHVVVSKLVG